MRLSRNGGRNVWQMRIKNCRRRERKEHVKKSDAVEDGEWGLAVQIQAVIRDAAVPLMWLSMKGPKSVRHKNIMHTLDNLDATLAVYRLNRESSSYRPKKI
jgi:hypothetical protein